MRRILTGFFILAISGVLGAQNLEYSRPLGLTTDGKDLYFTDGAQHGIKKFTLATGKLEFLAGGRGISGDQDGSFETAQFYEPSGITWSAGKLYICDTLNQKIRVADLKTRSVTTLWGPKTHKETLANPTGLLIQGDLLLVADTYNHSIRTLNLKTLKVETLAGERGRSGDADHRLNLPVGLLQTPQGLAITDQDNHRLGLRNPAGKLQWLDPGFKYPGALGFWGSDLWVADNGLGKVFKLSPQGKWQEIPQIFKALGYGSGPQGNFEGVQGFTTLGGHLYYVETITGGLWKLNPQTLAPQRLAGNK